MKTELFEIELCLSPRLAWMEKHGIKVLTDYHDRTEDQRWPFMACIPYRGQGFGNTETEALTSLAISMKIPLWNEQPSSRPVE